MLGLVCLVEFVVASVTSSAPCPLGLLVFPCLVALVCPLPLRVSLAPWPLLLPSLAPLLVLLALVLSTLGLPLLSPLSVPLLLRVALALVPLGLGLVLLVPRVVRDTRAA